MRAWKNWLPTAALLATGFLSGCGGTDAPQEPRTLVNGRYINNIAGVSLQVPGSWQSQLDYQSGTTTVDFMAVGPASGGVAPNVNVIIMKKQILSAPEVVVPLVRSELQKDPANRDYSDRVYQKDGHSVGEFIYTKDFTQGSLRLRQVYFVNRDKSIYITYTDSEAAFSGNAEFTAIDASMVIF